MTADSADAGTCQIPGKVDDLSDCTYSAVHSLNHLHVNPVVRELVRTAFFRYFKVTVMYCVRAGRQIQLDPVHQACTAVLCSNFGALRTYPKWHSVSSKQLQTCALPSPQ